jgi:hypothetical protein
MFFCSDEDNFAFESYVSHGFDRASPCMTGADYDMSFTAHLSLFVL